MLENKKTKPTMKQTVISNTAFSFEITVIGKFRVSNFNSEILIGEGSRQFIDSFSKWKGV